MIEYHHVDLAIVENAQDLSPIGEELKRMFIANKRIQIRFWQECLWKLNQ